MTNRPGQLQKALDGMGNTHSLQDLLDAIDAGTMQSFAKGDTWVLTQILTFPRQKVLEIFLYVGDLSDLEQLHGVVAEFARDQGCSMIRAFGRDGWAPSAKREGWQGGARIFWRTI